MTRSIVSSAIVAIAVALGAPAFASDTAPAVSGPQSAPVAKTQRYCFGEVQNGAQLRKNVCDTRANWLRQNIDPLHYMAK